MLQLPTPKENIVLQGLEEWVRQSSYSSATTSELHFWLKTHGYGGTSKDGKWAPWSKSTVRKHLRNLRDKQFVYRMSGPSVNYYAPARKALYRER